MSRAYDIAAQAAELEALKRLQYGIEPLEAYIARTIPKHGKVPRHLRRITRLFEASRHREVRATISMPPRHGKRVADSTPVLTPTGWRTHGELRVGDRVFAVDGTPTTVTYVSDRGPTDLAVTFSDGEVIRVHEGHLWTVLVRGVGSGKPGGYAGASGYRTLETAQLIGRLTSGTTRNGSPRARFLVDYPRPLVFPRADLPIDPYLFGLWLGDGSTGFGRITASPRDAEHHIKEIRSRGYEIGSVCTHKGTGVVSFYVLGTRVRDVVGDQKFIPREYMMASEEQRRDLLRGLVDSDGSVDKKGRVHFCNTNEVLVGQVLDLVATLGYRAGTYHVPGGHSSKTVTATRDHWVVSWSPHDGAQQAILPRKDRRVKAVLRRRSIVSIEPCESEDGQCIQVDHPSHLYLVGKTLVPTHNTVTLAAGLSWRTVYDPACLNFYAGFADDLAKSTSRMVRRTTRDAGAPLSAEAAAVSEWRTLYSGGLKATSVGGSITGRGANGGVIVVDDAVKGRDVAESLLQREKVWAWFKADVMSRLEPGASMIVCNTRWHQDDIIGRLQADGMGEDWEHISLPAVGDEDGKPIDERLEPERALALWPDGGYDIARLAKIRLRGEYDWWSLYQGVPRPPGATLFPGEPERFDSRTFSWNGKRGLIVCDPAATAKTSSDFSAVAVLAMEGYGDRSVLHVVDAWRGQVTIPALCRKLIDIQKAYLGLPVAVEAFGAFAAIPQTLREQAPGLRLLELGGDPKDPKAKLYRADKFTRAQPASKAWKGDGEGVPGGRIRLPHDAAWVHAWIQEHNDFTGLGDVHDDQVDTTAHGWNRLYQEAPGQRGGRSEEGADF